MQWQTLEPSTKIILKVILAGLAVVFLWLTREIIIVFLLAVVLASAMEPLVAYLHQRKVPRVVSVLAVYIIVIGIVGLVISLIMPLFVSQFNLMVANLPGYSTQLLERFPNIPVLLGDTDLGDAARHFIGSITGGGSILNHTVGIFNGFVSVITILVISFYLVAEQKGMLKLIRSLVPPKHQPFTMQLVNKIQKRMGFWVIGQIILSCSIFVLVYIGLTLLGVQYAFFLALLAGLLELIPYIGPIISAVPGILFALAAQGPAAAVIVALMYLLVQKAESYFLVPKIMEKTVGMSPLLVLVALLVGLKLAGVMGLLLAVPLVGAISLVVTELTHNQALQRAIEEPPA